MGLKDKYIGLEQNLVLSFKTKNRKGNYIFEVGSKIKRVIIN